MNPIVQEMLASVVRAGLKIAAGYLVAAGIWSGADADRYVAAGALALVGIGWSLWKTYGSRMKLLTSLASPRVMTERQCEHLAKQPDAPSVWTPKDKRP